MADCTAHNWCNAIGNFRQAWREAQMAMGNKPK